MPIDDRTTNRNYQLPNAGNQLSDDVARLRAALQAIDADVFARYTKTEVDTLINNLINGAPGALDTLNELAAAMGDDPNFAATVTNSIAAINAGLANRYTKAESDARYVQGAVQTEMVFTAGLNQTAYTLTTGVINKASALVTVDGVVQPTSEYSLSMDGLTLTLSEAPAQGATVRVLALGVASAGAPADDTVTTAKLRDGAVTTPKLADGALAASTAGRAKMADGYVNESKLADGAVTAAKLAAGVLPTIAARSDINGIHTTGTITSGTTSLTVASATGIVAGMVVTGEGIAPGTTVSTISGTTVTLSANAGATLSSDPVGFYDNTKALSPGSVGGQLCRAWVNFDGTGTVAIRASYNVSSITDNGTGDYTVNFTTAMPDANYAVCGNAGPIGNSSSTFVTALILSGQYPATTATFSTSSVRVSTSCVGQNAGADASVVTVAIFR